MRIFIGYEEIAGYCSSLQYILNGHGEKVHFCQLKEHAFYKRGKQTIIEKIYIVALKMKKQKRIFKVLVEIAKLALIAEMALSYDVFIFVGRYSPFMLKERKYLKLFKKKIISIFLGSDSRPLYLSGYLWDLYGNDLNRMYIEVVRQSTDIRTIERYSDWIICNPLSGQFLRKPFINFFEIGFPITQKRFIGLSCGTENQKNVRILHAPSRPKFKGTDLIIKAIEEIRDSGIPVDFVQIVGKPNEEVLSEITRCDFVIDQLYSDSPFAGLAVEAAVLNKATIVGSYAYDNILFKKESIPSLFVDPSNIKTAITSLIKDVQLRDSIANKAKSFVDDEWSNDKIANRYRNIIENKLELFCYYDPNTINYCLGWGIEKKELSEKLRVYINTFGIGGLCLPPNSKCTEIIQGIVSSNLKYELQPKDTA